MNGLEGIGSRQTTLSSLNAQDTAPASATQNKVGSMHGAKAPAAPQAATTDRASLSASGGLAAQGMDHSDVRLEKVSELRQAIANGTYNVPASAVADKIVESLLG